jgi:hypothetical protein
VFIPSSWTSSQSHLFQLYTFGRCIWGHVVCSPSAHDEHKFEHKHCDFQWHQFDQRRHSRHVYQCQHRHGDDRADRVGDSTNTSPAVPTSLTADSLAGQKHQNVGLMAGMIAGSIAILIVTLIGGLFICQRCWRGQGSMVALNSTESINGFPSYMSLVMPTLAGTIPAGLFELQGILCANKQAFKHLLILSA